MNQKFYELIELLNTEPRLYADKVYDYIKTNINPSNGKEFIELLEEKLNTSDKNPIKLAILYYALARDEYPKDFKKSEEYLDEAIAQIMSTPSYKKLDVYYSLLCVKAIYLNVLCKFYDSFIIANRCAKELIGSNNVNSLCAFDINLAYIANELGYPDTALAILNSFKENRKYLTPYTRLSLSKAYLLTFVKLENYSSYYEEYKKMETYTNNEETLISGLLIYYTGIKDLKNASIYKDKLLKKLEERNHYLSLSQDAETIISLARYYYMTKEFDEAYKYYKLAYDNLGGYAGQRMTISHEYIVVLHNIGMHEESYKTYLLLYEYTKIHTENLKNIISNGHFKEYSNMSSSYLSTMAKMDEATSFLNEALKCDNIYTILHKFFDLVDRFCPGSRLRISIKEKDGIYSFEKDYTKLVKTNSAKALDIFNSKGITHISSMLRPFLQGFNHIYPMRDGNTVVGYVLFDDKFLSYQDDATKNVAIDVVSTLFSAIKRNNKMNELKRNSRLDPLTKTYNRDALFDYLENISYNNTYLIEIDLDNFKLINDSFGHPAGDEVLKKLTTYLKKSFGSRSVFRFGGEEFVIITKLDKQTIVKKFNDIRALLIQSPVVYNGNEIVITLSYGGVIIKNSKDFKRAYEQADNILYEMKKGGKDRGFLE